MRDADPTERAQRGDAEAAREIVQTYYPSVLRFLSTLCANPADAEELTQEAFVKALRAIRRFRGESGLRTWLHRIAYHEFLHHCRSQKVTTVLDEAMSSPLFDTTSVLAMDLERALWRLTQEYRATFILCDVQGLTMRESAEVLGVPEGTIKSRLHAARRRLAEILEPERETTYYG
jgi:RNA polymerase sigma-70 factor (ECF subfamily)